MAKSAKPLGSASVLKEPKIVRPVDVPMLVVPIDAITALKFVDSSGTHFFYLEEVKKGEYVLKPRYGYPG